MNKLLILGLSSAFALGACGGAGTNSTLNDAGMASPLPIDNEDMNVSRPSAATASGMGFSGMVAAGDAYEVAAGKLAQQKATSQALKDFGGMMVAAHAESTVKLKAAGAKAVPAITVNPALTVEQEADIATLRDATGADFDAAYKAQQIAAHEKALSMMKDYAMLGEVPELKAFADEASKVVQMHLDKIRTL